MMWSLCMCFFFFFKQKTAYDMRISDWSSDVCSSDLPRARAGGGGDSDPGHVSASDRSGRGSRAVRGAGQQAGAQAARQRHRAQPRRRSEEHTSELQSLMRISYAVFCLKKKNTTLCKI